MLDIDSGEQINALYKFSSIKGGKKEEVFQTTDISEGLKYHKFYVAKYKKGLLLEIFPEHKVYNWKEKKVTKEF